MKATYVSVWDGGTEISSNCEYDPITTNVTLIGSVAVDLDDLEFLEREYIILPDGTEIERNYFITEFDTDDELTSEEIERLKILTCKTN